MVEKRRKSKSKDRKGNEEREDKGMAACRWKGNLENRALARVDARKWIEERR